MSKKLQLDIVTPERTVYSNEVDMVITRAAHGDVGILPDHTPFVSPLPITAVRVKRDEAEDLIAVSGGFLEVRPHKVTILTEAAELASEIDIDRAKASKKRAQERLDKGEGDLKRAERSLERAMNRLKVSGVED